MSISMSIVMMMMMMMMIACFSRSHFRNILYSYLTFRFQLHPKLCFFMSTGSLATSVLLEIEPLWIQARGTSLDDMVLMVQKSGKLTSWTLVVKLNSHHLQGLQKHPGPVVGQTGFLNHQLRSIQDAGPQE